MRRVVRVRLLVAALDLCVLAARERVLGVGDHGVVTGAAVDGVGLLVADVDPVVAGSRADAVLAMPAADPVAVGAAEDRVVALAARDPVVAGTAREVVVALAALDAV